MNQSKTTLFRSRSLKRPGRLKVLHFGAPLWRTPSVCRPRTRRHGKLSLCELVSVPTRYACKCKEGGSKHRRGVWEPNNFTASKHQRQPAAGEPCASHVTRVFWNLAVGKRHLTRQFNTLKSGCWQEPPHKTVQRTMMYNLDTVIGAFKEGGEYTWARVPVGVCRELLPNRFLERLAVLS